MKTRTKAGELEVMVGFESEAMEDVIISMVNLLGEVKIKKQVTANTGWQEVTLDINDITPGNYILLIEGENLHKSQTLVIE